MNYYIQTFLATLFSLSILQVSHGKMDHQMDYKLQYGKLLGFTPKDLYVGKTFLSIFPYPSSSNSHFSSPKFLPKHIADSIPFSSSYLPNLIRHFRVPPHSSLAKSMEETLNHCEATTIMGETKYCATSLESMLEFAHKTFGSNYNISVITTTHLTDEKSNYGSIGKKKPHQTPQKYTILVAPSEIRAPKRVSCHPMTYLYPVFLCHNVVKSKSYRILLGGGDGSSVEAVAICHMDTSEWRADTPLLVSLGLVPGKGAVCHFMPPSHLSIIATSS